MLRYTLLRLLLLLVCAALLWVVGLRGLWLALLAVLLSGIISAFALVRQRDRASATLDDRLRRINARIDERAAAEADDDPEDHPAPEPREPPAESRP